MSLSLKTLNDMESSQIFNQHLISYSVLIFLPVLLATSQIIPPTKHGFSLKLIDPLSPLSPFFNPNLTDTERFNRILKSDRGRLRYLTSLNAGTTNFPIDPTEIQPGLSSHDLSYMVMTGIGTGAAFQNYYLHLDTGSSLTWIQCEPCHPCFQQQQPIFNPLNSPSYLSLMAFHPYCRSPDYQPGPNGLCHFSMFYADGTSANGILSSETFTFPSSQGGNIQVPNVVFGCTHLTDTDYPLGGPVGIFGLDLEQESFISQPSCAPVTGLRFSYCLVEPGSNIPMALRFGADITWPPVARVQQTQILRFSTGPKQYYVNLTGISIDDTSIYFAPGTFDRNPSGGGGFVLDSGSHFTYLPELAYRIVRNALVLHFQARHLMPLVPGGDEAVGLDLCYDLLPNVDPKDLLPSMTFHFAGADLPLFYEQVFHVDLHQQQFCLAMLPETDVRAPGILGAFQQVNTQFEFDTSNGGILRMATVDCAHGV
ncbi:Eukaryotic aspartyl protease family protein [Rhynchospora pubera]|uniref:Eukaryotic aspartyl protease family protein n=2 Tax=Rhynchospora pubera TaxID=906938 RepID=A0AAV8E8H1_9POAL|nr:Eukaryotic aspartyl protease family protein [Rhynchospora pubera]